MADGMPWTQKDKLILAGNTIATWRTQGEAAGILITQVNAQLLPPVGQEGDPPADVVFSWDSTVGEFLMRTD